MLVILMAVALPAPSHAGLRAGVTLVGTLTLEQEVLLSAFWNGAVWLPAGFVLSGRGALIDRGLHPGLANQGIRLPILAGGGAGQLLWVLGSPVGRAFDLIEYESDPERFEHFFEEEPYFPRLGLTLSAEAGVVTQPLETPDVFAGSRQVTTGYFDFQARVRLSPVRLFLSARIRPIDFVLFDGPGFPPYRAWPAGTTLGDEVTLMAGGDCALADTGLTLGLGLRVRRPAFFFVVDPSLLANNPPPWLVASRVIIVESPTVIVVLPAGQSPRLAWTTQFTARFALRSTLFVAFQLDWEHDPNRVTFRENAAGQFEPVSDLFNLVNLLLAIQARF